MKNIKYHSDINIRTYLEYEKWFNNLTNEQKIDENYIMYKTIQFFYNFPVDKYEKFTYEIVLHFYNHLVNILNMKEKLVQTFKLNGVEYGLVPNFDDITMGELIDLNDNDIIKQMCILYRPILKKKGSKYTVIDYKADISMYDSFKDNLSLNVYNGFVSFFLRIQLGFIHIIQRSLEKEVDIPQEMKKNIVKNGSGLDGFIG